MTKNQFLTLKPGDRVRVTIIQHPYTAKVISTHHGSIVVIQFDGNGERYPYNRIYVERA